MALGMLYEVYVGIGGYSGLCNLSDRFTFTKIILSMLAYPVVNASAFCQSNIKDDKLDKT